MRTSEALVFLPRTGAATCSGGADEGDGKARQGDGGCGEMVMFEGSTDWFKGKITGKLHI